MDNNRWPGQSQRKEVALNMKTSEQSGQKPDLVLDRPDLIAYLWKVQNEHGHIRFAHIEAAAKALDISTIDVEGVISFYHFFSRYPTGEFTVHLNASIVSKHKGFERVKEAFEAATGGQFGGVDPSGQFGLFETACIGLSDMEPAALINFYPFTNLNSLKVKQIVAKLKQGANPADICNEIPDHIRSVPEGDKAILLRDYEHGKAVEKLAQFEPGEVIEEIKKSGLRGQGGAFFPTGLKWQFCAGEPGDTKYIVCNADEGEPGTFKDRVLLNSRPGLLLEGMITAGYAVGAKEGYIYLRAEYIWLLDKLEDEIKRFRKMGLLGRDAGGIKGFRFDIHIKLGAGAYVCGEETALLNSMEGKRGEPRNKRFFPTQRGYLQKPTVVNNVETFCVAARIMELSADHYLTTGTETSPGTKLISVSGDCKRPGVYEIEWGTTVRDILEMADADRPHFIQVSGPSGQCISMEEADQPIALDKLPCGGSFMIFSRQRDILGILRNYTSFFKHESCGLCTPCRAGNFIIEKQLDLFAAKLGHKDDLEDVRSLGKIMQLTCRCGLGKTAPNSILSAQAKFPEYFEGLVDQNPNRLSRHFSLKDAIRDYDRFSS